ncbi:hypothetical protein WJR50_06300 [Catalinimonas sp. 4WD22]|uniref:hypothetical protein n=1 Tax=Catalinimonas locisalis TaxID=3133978 RepID=UPI0031015BAA
MNLKVITAFLMIWMVLLTLLLLLGNVRHDNVEERYFLALEEELDRLPAGTTEKQVLALHPELLTIRQMLDQASNLKCRLQEMIRNPAPIYCKEMADEKERCQQEIRKLTQAVSGLLYSREVSAGNSYIQPD